MESRVLLSPKRMLTGLRLSGAGLIIVLILSPGCTFVLSFKGTGSLAEELSVLFSLVVSLLQENKNSERKKRMNNFFIFNKSMPVKVNNYCPLICAVIQKLGPASSIHKPLLLPEINPHRHTRKLEILS